MRLPDFDDQVFSRTVALRRGDTDDGLSRRQRDGSLRRIRPGAYAIGDAWASLHAEDRARWAAAATAHASRGAPLVFSHATAAALHGLPLFRVDTTRVHLTVDGPARSTARVLRHRMPLPPTDVEWIDEGIVGVTSLARTVVDLAGSLLTEAAVTIADAALRQTALRGRADPVPDLDLDAGEDLRLDLSDRIEARPGARGIRAARFVVAFADARADRPGESISRLYLHRLGYAPPGLQVAVPGPHGHDYAVDFDLGAAWGEFDGALKYTDPLYLRGRAPAQALADEKAREDWIRGTTGKRIVRWQMPHLSSPETFGRLLRSFGIRPHPTE
ncbi:hypothetical protein AB0N73_07285 [Microbacterium sp. NPDC089189]|uniref:hypothetical protein n=1 Tax=Microbacterium sp. NPDC089189 TaxID=3154972 RepID=UPI00343F05E9